MENTTIQQTMAKNEEWKLAWQIANNTDTNLFLTGKAGTGKTTFLHYLKEHTDKRLVVLAPTGIAAINARGVTIHSFFQLPFTPFLPGTTQTEQQSHYRFSKEKLKIIRGCDLIVIDEISMVRADLLDAVDDALRRFRRCNKPFGGVQMLLIGDLQQLAPVAKDEEWSMLSRFYASPYFFDSLALRQTDYATIELKKVYRQDDSKFISILNKIRENNIDEATLAELNKRFIPDFKSSAAEGYIRLTTHNAYARSVNESELEALSGTPYSFEAKTEGNFPEYSYPTDKTLTLKRGAQVMFVKNDTSGNKLYYNGMIGEVKAITANGLTVRAKETGELIDVKQETWQNCRYRINEETKEITEEVDGTFTQYPLKTAWAITIHKSQGLTFSHAIIDVHSSFAHGQTYVALSRCKTLEGLVLSAPVTRQAIISDDTVDRYTQHAQAQKISESDIAGMHRRYLANLVSELFDFTALGFALANMTRVLDEHLYRSYPKLLAEYKSEAQAFHERIAQVAARFHTQYEAMLAQGNGETTPELQDRITRGARYFLKETLTIKDLFMKTQPVTTNNKQLKKQLDNAKENLAATLEMKTGMLAFAATQNFSTAAYLQAKAAILLGREPAKTRKQTERKAGKTAVPDGNLHPSLMNELTAWRTEKMRQEGLPSYCILSQKALTGISNLLPIEMPDLLQIPGIGKAKAEKYGLELLSLTRRYRKEHAEE